jgi:glutamine amidotransferase
VTVVDVVDRPAGVAAPVLRAYERLGVPARAAWSWRQVAAAERLVLAGTGPADEAVAALEEAGLVEVLCDRVAHDHTPLLAVGTGLHLLFERADDGRAKCLGLLAGEVVRLPPVERVPHEGWDELRLHRDHPVRAGLPDRCHAWFRHAAHPVPEDPAVVVATVEHGRPVCAMVAAGPVVGVQFHPERSGWAGGCVLAAFATFATAPAGGGDGEPAWP